MSRYNEYIQSIKDICELEKQVEIFENRIDSIPIWATVFLKYRGKYTEKFADVAPLSNHGKLNFKNCIYTTIKSGMQLLKLYFSSRKIENIIYGFPRLEKINGKFIDKFCDELIRSTALNDNYLYLARSRSFIHPQPRDLENIVWIEFIDNISIIMGRMLYPLFYIRNRKNIQSLFNKANTILPINGHDKRYIISQISTTVIKYRIAATLFKKLEVKRIFAPVLSNKIFLIAVAKKLNIPCFELQHGMTEGPTRLYSGQYLSDFSPTAFLAFGKSSMIPVFNVPMYKMYNIGFAYKKFLQSQITTFKPNQYLLISDPEITQQMVEIATELAQSYPECKFSIRFHPHEKPTLEQVKYLQNHSITITDNTENSSLAILKYEGVIGELSTMLYEALNIGRKAAKIHFKNLNSEIDEDKEKMKGFFIMNNIEDFKRFMTYILNQNQIIEFYSDFNPSEFNKILKFNSFLNIPE